MLANLIKRQKLWVVPLMISLAFSWCALLCQNVAQAAVSHDKVSGVAMPPCHSMAVSETAEPAAGVSGHDSDTCSGCDTLAVNSVAIELPVLCLLALPLAPGAVQYPMQANGFYPVQEPPYPRTTPLYIQKSALLI